MKHIASLIVGLLLAGAAHTGDVYVTTDAQGHRIYTDTPQSVPAQKIDMHLGSAAPAAAEDSSKTKRGQPAATTPSEAQAQPAAQLSAEERVAQCAEARQQYQALLTSLRVYKIGPDGEPVYLTVEEMSQARAKHQQYIDQFCTGQ